MDEFINASGLRRRTQLQPTGQSELELMAPDSYLVLRSPDTYLVHRSPDTYLVQFIHTLHTPYTHLVPMTARGNYTMMVKDHLFK